ncbi:helix-turn-helix domain-containing protein [Streptomyces thermolineatus]|uniref:Helix-turn-helix domain-containing protein n=1 Tax=Streptomyces thermolineatus TaxID=44033 RepID=A0ABN3L4K9_9ACTN
MRTERGRAGDEGSWEIRQGLPDPRLRGRVLGYRGHRMDLGGPRRRLEVPLSAVTLVVEFESTVLLTDAAEPGRSATLSSLVSGVHWTATVGEYAGRLHGVTVSLTPAGAYEMLGPVVGDLGNQWADPADVLGTDGRDLAARLTDAPDWPSRYRVLDRFFVSRLLEGTPWRPEVAFAWRELHRTGGTMPIRRLAGTTGYSLRRLETLFRRQVGLTPKQAAQVLRLRRVLQMYEREPGLGGAEIAARCGFFDQAHLDHTFRAMVGCSPRRFFAHRSASGSTEPVDRLAGTVTSALLPTGTAGAP